jgi:hypothetical protein
MAEQSQHSNDIDAVHILRTITLLPTMPWEAILPPPKKNQRTGSSRLSGHGRRFCLTILPILHEQGTHRILYLAEIGQAADAKC